MLSEAIQRLQIEAFLNVNGIENFENDLSLLQTFQETLSERSMNESKHIFNSFNNSFTNIYSTCTDFITTRSNESELFRYMYCK